MPIAAALLPLFLSLTWCVAFLIAKLISPKIGEIHINTVILLSISVLQQASSASIEVKSTTLT